MSSPIGAISTQTQAALSMAENGPKGPKMATGLHKVAKEFETMLVHQLLDAAKIAGEGQGAGYGSMAVDALANGVSQAGGLGIAQQIETALAPHSHVGGSGK